MTDLGSAANPLGKTYTATLLATADGTVGAPAFSWNANQTCGMYRIGTNDIGFSTNSLLGLEIGSNRAISIRGSNTDTNSTAGVIHITGTGATDNHILRFAGNSGANDNLLYVAASASDLRFAITNGTTTTDLMSFDQSGRITTTVAAANINRLIFNDGNGQKEFIETYTGASSGGLLFAVNRDPVSGTFAKTGQTASWLQIDSSNASGSVSIFSTNTNNSTPSGIVSFSETSTSWTSLTTSKPVLSVAKNDGGTANQDGGSLDFFDRHAAATGRNAGVTAGQLRFYFSQPTSGSDQLSASIAAVSEAQSGVVTPSDLIFKTYQNGSLNTVLSLTDHLSITQGISNGTRYIMETLNAGSNGNISRTYAQRTVGVSTTAQTILSLDQYCNLVLVSGSNGTDIFGDVVFCSFGNATVTTIAGLTGVGSPATRTYSVNSGNLRVAMGSSTYTICVRGMDIRL